MECSLGLGGWEVTCPGRQNWEHSSIWLTRPPTRDCSEAILPSCAAFPVQFVCLWPGGGGSLGHHTLDPDGTPRPLLSAATAASPRHPLSHRPAARRPISLRCAALLWSTFQSVFFFNRNKDGCNNDDGCDNDGTAVIMMTFSDIFTFLLKFQRLLCLSVFFFAICRCFPAQRHQTFCCAWVRRLLHLFGAPCRRPGGGGAAVHGAGSVLHGGHRRGVAAPAERGTGVRCDSAPAARGRCAVIQTISGWLLEQKRCTH